MHKHAPIEIILIFYYIKKGLTKLNFLMFYSDIETLTLLASGPPLSAFTHPSDMAWGGL